MNDSADPGDPPLSSFVSVAPSGALRTEGGLLALVRGAEPPDAAARSVRRLAADPLRRLAALGEPTAAEPLAALAARARPSEPEAAMLALGAPPMMGGEYWGAAPLVRALEAFDGALAAAWAEDGRPFADFVRSLSPAWRDTGKISLRLAENKGDGAAERPFAFLASFSHRDESGTLRRYPLATALRLFAAQPGALESLLAPVRTAARTSGLLREMLESRRLFRPCAWDARTALRFLRDAPQFEAAGLEVATAALWRGAPPRVKVRAAFGPAAPGAGLSARSLLGFSAELSLDGEPLTPDERAALFASDGMVRLRGRWVAADPEKLRALLERWREAERLARGDGVGLLDGLRLLAGAARGGALAEAAADPDSELAAEGAFADALRGLSDPAALPPPRLPEALRRTLRPYQQTGVRFLCAASRLGLGVCLADDMGLGKTLQTLAFLCAAKAEGALERAPALLVAPATLLANWHAEARRFTPDLRIATLHPAALGPDGWRRAKEDPAAALRGVDLALTTYGLLARTPALAEAEWSVAVADEAQNAKNPGSRQSRALRALHAPRRVALTGTPVENRLGELWSLFDFLDRGLLGTQKKFVEFAKSLGDDLTPLRRLVRPFLLRRLKTDKALLPDLPDKTERTVHCGLSPKQVALYERCAEDLGRALSEPGVGTTDEGRRGLVLKFLPRFKQICNHPSQFLGDGEFAPADSGKFRALAELCEELAARQERVLVFTQFREMTEPLRTFLHDLFGRDGLVLHGGTPVKERAALVARFQAPDGPPFFVLSLKAAGTGLNLTAASHVVHFDRWWNPAVEDQASDRAYRIGQKRNVLVHKFVCRGTLEERIDELIAGKRELARALLGPGGGAEKLLSDMSAAELRALVALDPAAAPVG